MARRNLSTRYVKTYGEFLGLGSPGARKAAIHRSVAKRVRSEKKKQSKVQQPGQVQKTKEDMRTREIRAKIRELVRSNHKCDCTEQTLGEIYQQGYETGFLDRDLSILLESKKGSGSGNRINRVNLILWQVKAPGYGILKVRANTRDEAINSVFKYLFFQPRYTENPVSRADLQIVGNVPELVNYIP